MLLEHVHILNSFTMKHECSRTKWARRRSDGVTIAVTPPSSRRLPKLNHRIAPGSSSSRSNIWPILPSFTSPKSSGRKLVRPALLFGPRLGMCARVLLEDLDVGVVLHASNLESVYCPSSQVGIWKHPYQLFPTKCADGLWFAGFDGCAVRVDLDAGAGRIGLLVLARDSVFLGDGHGCAR